MQENHLTRTPSNSICPRERLCSRDSFHVQRQPSQDADPPMYRNKVPIWCSGTCKAFLIHVELAQEAIKKKVYFKACYEASEAHQEHRGAIKQAKTQLAELDGSTGGEAGT